MDSRINFYKKILQKRLKDKDYKILVVGGNQTDVLVFKELEFTNVTISNIDNNIDGKKFYPFIWINQNMEHLLFENETYDYVIVHACLHHCFSPHRALLEMYRVAKKGIIFFESRDSLIMRIAEFLNFTQKYEHAAVFFNQNKYGGVENSDIPNYIYRWTEREIEKVISSYAPYAEHKFTYDYGYGVPVSTEYWKQKFLKRTLKYLLTTLYLIVIKLFPRQKNLFACFIEKPNLKKQHFKWLKIKNQKLVFNSHWSNRYYKRFL